jgi:citrate synthase
LLIVTESLTVRDNRTGVEYDIPITDGTIRAADLGKIKANEDNPGLAVYDPGFVNTASCRSSVTYIDGDKGVLEYRGYPIEQLAEKSNFLEVSYLLVHGDLPTKEEYDAWVHEITYHTFVHENIKEFMQGFRYDPTRWACSWRRSVRCRRSTRTPPTSPTPTTVACRSSG